MGLPGVDDGAKNVFDSERRAIGQQFRDGTLGGRVGQVRRGYLITPAAPGANPLDQPAVSGAHLGI